jgi:hypothetical protein
MNTSEGLSRQILRLTPRYDSDLAHWWSSLSGAVPKKQRKDLNALVMLVTRCLWLERNSRVFDKFATIPLEVVRKIKAELEQWQKAMLCGLEGDRE